MSVEPRCGIFSLPWTSLEYLTPHICHNLTFVHSDKPTETFICYFESRDEAGAGDANDLLVHLQLGEPESSRGAFVSTHSVKAVHPLHYPEQSQSKTHPLHCSQFTKRTFALKISHLWQPVNQPNSIIPLENTAQERILCQDYKIRTMKLAHFIATAYFNVCENCAFTAGASLPLM